MIRGEIPTPSMCSTLPMQLVEVEKGRVVFHASANEKHLNPMGGVHGGFAATVLDSVTGCVIHSMLEVGVGYGTIDLSIKMTRPIPRDEVIIAEGTIVNLSKSLGISEAKLKNKEGKLLATATATCMILSN